MPTQTATRLLCSCRFVYGEDDESVLFVGGYPLRSPTRRDSRGCPMHDACRCYRTYHGHEVTIHTEECARHRMGQATCCSCWSRPGRVAGECQRCVDDRESKLQVAAEMFAESLRAEDPDQDDSELRFRAIELYDEPLRR